MRALVSRSRRHARQAPFGGHQRAGDRRDEDIREQTAILGNAFDDIFLFQDACQRGRADGEVLKLLREGLTQASRATRGRHLRRVPGRDTALNRLSPGDLCLVLVGPN